MNQEFDLNLYFQTRDKLDSGWETVKVIGTRVKDGEPGFEVYLNGTTALDDIESSNVIAFVKDDDVIESLDLANCKFAVSALRTCASENDRHWVEC